MKTPFSPAYFGVPILKLSSSALRVFRVARSALVSGLAVATAVMVTAPARANDYEGGPVWEFRRGEGFKVFGEAEYCQTYGYPDSTLRMNGLREREVDAYRVGERDALLVVRKTGDRALVRLYGERGEDCAIGVFRIEFEGGVVWSGSLRDRPARSIPYSSREIEGTSGNDKLKGTDDIDGILAGAGDDLVYGYRGADALSGGPGDDVLYGYEGDDVLVGGSGDDDLYGDEGDDYFVFDAGFGYDVIDDAEGNMTLVFRDKYPWDVSFAREGDGLILTFSGSTDRIRIRDYYRSSARLVRAVFGNFELGPDELARYVP